ncbi:hypothetical protein ACTGWR_09430, partial [Streptococcus suis]
MTKARNNGLLSCHGFKPVFLYEKNQKGVRKNSSNQKHTKISSEEISDGRKYSLLFLYDKVEVSCLTLDVASKTGKAP